MSITVTLLSNASDADKLLLTAAKFKSDLEFRKTSLIRSRLAFAENAQEYQDQLASVNIELAGLETSIAALPEGKTRKDNIAEKKKLDLKQFQLNEKIQSYSAMVLLDKEFDIDQIDRQIAGVVDYMAALEARKVGFCSLNSLGYNGKSRFRKEAGFFCDLKVVKHLKCTTLKQIKKTCHVKKNNLQGFRNRKTYSKEYSDKHPKTSEKEVVNVPAKPVKKK